MSSGLYIVILIIAIAFAIHKSKKEQVINEVVEDDNKQESRWQIRIWRDWTPKEIRKNKDGLFVFSDTVDGTTTRGQAKVRNEPNTIGIPVKNRPFENEDAYFDDDDYEHNIQAIDNAVVEVRKKMTRRNSSGKRYKYLVFPHEGLGSDEELARRAPRTYAHLIDKIEELCAYDRSETWLPWLRRIDRS